MYPEQQPPQAPQQPQPSGSYLDQIAPSAQKTPIVKKLTRFQLIAGGLILVLVLTVIIGLVAKGIGGGTKPLHQLAARLNTTTSLVESAQPLLKNTELRNVNSSLKISLTNANRDLISPLSQQNVNTKKLDEATVAQESGTNAKKRLDDARLNAVYDRTYAREMAYQLDRTLVLMRQLNKTTGNKDLQAFLTTTIENLAPLQQSFADFNAANG